MRHKITLYKGALVQDSDATIPVNIQELLNGKSVLQAGMIQKNEWLFWDENYFNLMASMRKMRMNIPMDFTLDYFKNLIQPQLSPILSYTYEIYVFEENKSISHYISIQKTEQTSFNENYHFEIDVFKELKIFPDYLTAIKNGQAINIVAEQYASDNEFKDVLLLNTELKVARSTKGNIYYVQGDEIVGCKPEEGTYRQGIDQEFEKKFNPQLSTFSAFELQKADEVFILSEKEGIIPITQFRKKKFEIQKSLELREKLIQ